jgi:hypothetical protein
MTEIVSKKPLEPVLHGFLLKEDRKFVPYLKEIVELINKIKRDRHAA